MYGMVNKAIQDLICSRFGAETWEQVKQHASVELDVFIGNDGYPDQVTYDLVAAASAVTGISSEEILFASGRHWVLKIARTDYGPMLEAGGRTLPEFLDNLPNFHSRVSLVFPNLQPPGFQVSDIGDDSLVLHYLTHRDGLGSFVRGILDGLGEMFGPPLEVTQRASKHDGADHDEFLVTWGPSERNAQMP